MALSLTQVTKVLNGAVVVTGSNLGSRLPLPDCLLESWDQGPPATQHCFPLASRRVGLGGGVHAFVRHLENPLPV